METVLDNFTLGKVMQSNNWLVPENIEPGEILVHYDEETNRMYQYDPIEKSWIAFEDK